MDTEISEAVGVFVRYANLRQNRLEYGMKMRAEMHKALTEGKRPPGYRAHWIKENAAVLLSVLGEIAKDFDSQHPEDKCSLADLMDVTATCMGMLKKENGTDDD